MNQYSRRTLGGSLSALVLCVACSRGEVELGGGALAQDLAAPTRCASSPIVEGDVEIRNQSELDALGGCEAVTGNLYVAPFADVDLTPLASLRTVEGTLWLGASLPPTGTAEEQEAAQLADQALRDTGVFESLEGLESLERLGQLWLESVWVPDLSAFESLRSAVGLTIRDAKQLRDLAGLEQATFRDVFLSQSPALETLEGLRVQNTMGEVTLDLLPALANADALVGITHVNRLSMTGTGLVSLPAMAGVSVADLMILANPALVDASGLDTITGIDNIFIVGNDQLRAIPDLSNVIFLESLVISSNGSIEEVSLNFPALQSQMAFRFEGGTPLSAAYLDISANASLRRITSPATFDAVQVVTVELNPSLAELDFGGLERVDFLTIADNAALAAVTVPSLATVDSLTVTNNPAFDPSVFDTVATFSREITGNAVPSAL